MAKSTIIDNQIYLKAQQFAKHIKSKGIQIDKAIIYGSWAKGNQNKDSDIDICLVSPTFGHDEIAELQFLLRQTRYVDDSIEPMPISSQEFKESSSPLIVQIKKYGREVII